jgi:hypothetical protein
MQRSKKGTRTWMDQVTNYTHLWMERNRNAPLPFRQSRVGGLEARLVVVLGREEGDPHLSLSLSLLLLVPGLVGGSCVLVFLCLVFEGAWMRVSAGGGGSIDMCAYLCTTAGDHSVNKQSIKRARAACSGQTSSGRI